MLINEDVIKQVREIYRNRFNSIIFKIAGPEALSHSDLQELINRGLIDPNDQSHGLISDAYHISRIRGGDPFETRHKTSLPKFREEIKRLLPKLSQREQFALDHIKRSAGNFITKLRDNTLADIEGSIRSHNYDERNKMLTEVIRPTIEEGIEGAKVTVREVASRLRERTGDAYRDWKRVAVTELSNALNLGAADAIVSRNANKPMNEIYIYKLAHLDGALCEYCRKFYLESDGVTPRVFTMAELASNGSNYGKKASEWQPTLGATHPNERCELVELPNGWGFEPGSNQASFVDKDFVWQHRKK